MPSRLAVHGLLLVLATSTVVSLLSAQEPTELTSKARNGDLASQASLANDYHLGKDMPQDDAEAVHWWKKAAEKGDLASEVNLGIAYQLGVGVPKNYTAAAHWYRGAADQGNADAQSNLGMLYHLGLGIPKDDAEAARM